ncbi:MAG: hypothetical protein ACK5PB_16060 [Pirellula sp.]
MVLLWYSGTGTSNGNLSYTWDANKNKTSETIGGTMSGYGFTSAGTTYDDEDRLTGFARTNGTFNQSWNLTKVGDWTSVTTNGTAQNRTHGPTHELLTAGGRNISTDVKGNITLLPSNLTPQTLHLKAHRLLCNGTSIISFEVQILATIAAWM